MADVAPLVADGGQLRLVRRLAAFAYGERTVEWPEDFDGPEKDLPDERVFGYVAKLPGKAPGRSERRFTRSDIQIDAVNHTSTTEQVLDAAERKTGGDAFVETVISGRGLGRQVPGVDFRLGDRVPVRLWGRILPGQLVTEVSWEGTVPSVKVGGQVLADLEALDRDVLEQKRAIAQERRERLKDVGAVSRAASRAQSTADSAQSTADSAVDAVREEAAQRQRVDDELLDAIDGQAREAERLADGLAGAITSADFEKYDGELQRRLWGEQGEFNRISAQFQDKQSQINRQQNEINAANEAFKDQQRQINDARDSFEQSQVQINDAVDSSAQDQADLIESMTRQLDSLRSQLAAVSGSVWQVGTPDDGIFSIERELVSGFNKYFLVVNGSWVGRGVVSFNYTEGYGDSARSVPVSVPIEVGTQRRFELTNDKRPYGVIVNYRVDDGRMRARELTISSQTVGQSYTALTSRFTTPIASPYAVNVDLTWLNAHRGALYAIRVMAYGKSGSTRLGSISRDSIGPLGPAGNGRRTMTLAVEKQLEAGVEIVVEAMCDHSGEFQRQVDGGSVTISWIV